MYQRNSERVPVDIEAEIMVQNVTFPASVKNVSACGICARIAHAEPSGNIDAHTFVDLILQLPLGRAIRLHCVKKWSEKNTSNSLIENIGAEIIDPPEEYRQFVRSIEQHILSLPQASYTAVHFHAKSI